MFFWFSFESCRRQPRVGADSIWGHQGCFPSGDSGVRDWCDGRHVTPFFFALLCILNHHHFCFWLWYYCRKIIALHYIYIPFVFYPKPVLVKQDTTKPVLCIQSLSLLHYRFPFVFYPKPWLVNHRPVDLTRFAFDISRYNIYNELNNIAFNWIYIFALYILYRDISIFNLMISRFAFVISNSSHAHV